MNSAYFIINLEPGKLEFSVEIINKALCLQNKILYVCKIYGNNQNMIIGHSLCFYNHKDGSIFKFLVVLLLSSLGV